MKHEATQALFSYWNHLRGERAAPERRDIDPTAIRDVLADTFMLDVDLTRRFPFRLAGTRVNGLFDQEQKGRSFLDLWRHEERRNIAAILVTVADGARPVVTGGVTTIAGRGEYAIELLFLPLRHHGRTHARMLGLMRLMDMKLMDMKLFDTPAWTGMLPIGPISLRSLRMIDDEECDAYRPMEKIAVGQSLAPAVYADPHVTPALAARPRLRVIDGGLSGVRR